MPNHAALPFNLPPRLISREAAAAYIGVSPSKFDQMVKDRRMPPPKRIDGRRVWDIRALDISVDLLPTEGGPTQGGPSSDPEIVL
jgi:predicted DNA-binding transcriptional regulator AlpA